MPARTLRISSYKFARKAGRLLCLVVIIPLPWARSREFPNVFAGLGKRSDSYGLMPTPTSTLRKFRRAETCTGCRWQQLWDMVPLSSRVSSISDRECETARSGPAPRNTVSPALWSHPASVSLSKLLAQPLQFPISESPTDYAHSPPAQAKQITSLSTVVSTQMPHNAPSHSTHRYSV